MTPFFINSPSGNLFALYHTPEEGTKLKRNILFIPPFAEELNRSRHMINRQARDFTKAGYGVLVLDLSGTGDSEGLLSEATIPRWQQDILAAVSWLKETSDQPPIFWAMRSGALIAANLIQRQPHITNQLILWSPVSDGKKFISQFMRLKLTAMVTQKTNAQQTNLKDLWAKLDTGEDLEIAGYSLSPDLAHGFSTLSLSKIKLPQALSVLWAEISLSDPPKISLASERVIERWTNNNIDVSTAATNDIAFWTLQEPEWADNFCAQTTALLTQ